MMKGKGEYIEIINVPELESFKECKLSKKKNPNGGYYKTPLLEPKLENVSGVYIIFLGKDVMYIGMSSNLFFRIEQHIMPILKSLQFNYDKICYLPVKSETEASILEAIYIKIFKPKHNKKLNGEWIKYGSKKIN